MSGLEGLFQAVVEGREGGAELTRRALDDGAAPADVLAKAVTPAMSVVGDKVEAGEYFIPDLLLSARVAEQAAKVVKPLLAQCGGVKPVDTVIIGTVEGDLDSVGKDLAKVMLEGTGFEVIDLGLDVPPRQFVTAAEESRADIVAVFAHLTTTMPMMRAVIEGLVEVGRREHVKVLLGGAPVTQRFAARIGADGYASNAAAAARLARGWMGSDAQHSTARRTCDAFRSEPKPGRVG